MCPERFNRAYSNILQTNQLQGGKEKGCTIIKPWNLEPTRGLPLTPCDFGPVTLELQMMMKVVTKDDKKIPFLPFSWHYYEKNLKPTNFTWFI
jgi:hypothetical protein